MTPRTRDSDSLLSLCAIYTWQATVKELWLRHRVYQMFDVAPSQPYHSSTFHPSSPPSGHRTRPNSNSFFSPGPPKRKKTTTHTNTHIPVPVVDISPSHPTPTYPTTTGAQVPPTQPRRVRCACLARKKARARTGGRLHFGDGGLRESQLPKVLGVDLQLGDIQNIVAHLDTPRRWEACPPPRELRAICCRPCRFLRREGLFCLTSSPESMVLFFCTWVLEAFSQPPGLIEFGSVKNEYTESVCAVMLALACFVGMCRIKQQPCCSQR